MDKFAKNGAKINKLKFIQLLQQVKGDTINFKALHFTFPIDIKNLRTALPQSVTQSDFGEFENKIRADERGNRTPMMLGMAVGIITLVLVIVDIALHFI
jgi:hypothetical protein